MTVEYEPYFVIRTPTLPYNKAFQISDEEVDEHFRHPLLQESIMLASPSLYQRLMFLLRGELVEREADHVRQSLRKYLIRSCTRSTPFGLFASVSVGYWADETLTTILPDITRVTRLDSDVLARLVTCLLNQPLVSERIKYFPNNTLYHLDNKIRYVESQQLCDKKVYQLSDVEADPVLEKILNATEQGICKPELVTWIKSKLAFDEEEAIELVNDLVENQLLVHELQVKITGEDYFQHVMHVLGRMGVHIKSLEDIKTLLSMFDKNAPEENLEKYPILIEKLQQFVPDLRATSHFQVDSFRKSNISLNSKVAHRIQSVSGILYRLQPPGNKTVLSDFKRRFFSRYEFECVDLCLALDPETGIGYPPDSTGMGESKLLSELPVHESKRTETYDVSDYTRFLIYRYSEALLKGKDIQLEESELAPYFTTPRVPSSLYAIASVHARNEHAVDSGDYLLWLKGVHGPSATKLLARFTHLDDTLLHHVRSTASKEEDSDSIYAEVVHSNQTKTSNISSRSVLRSYEIPILASGGVDTDHTIPLHDLTLSVAAGELILQSKRLKKRIIPRLSSAHNYTHDTISVYRFLCDLQYQGVTPSLTWNWSILRSASYLPRVSINGVIVSPARWTFSSQELESIRQGTDLRSTVNILRKNHTLPQRIVVGEGDNKVPIDLDNSNHLRLFQKLIASTETVEECLFTEEQLVVTDHLHHGYAHELIIPFIQTGMRSKNSGQPSQKTTLPRRLPHGSEWLYLKIYCNDKATDHLLLGCIKPFAEKLLKENTIDQFFFVRYADPDNHIRFRLHGKGDFHHTIAADFSKTLNQYIDSGLIKNITTEIYTRELERYGHDNIIHTESIFSIDSFYALQLLECIGNDETLRWQLTLLVMHQYFYLFNIPLAEAADIAHSLQQGYFQEKQVDQNLKRSMAQLFRANRLAIHNVINESELPKIITVILNKRQEMLRVVADKILQASGAVRSVPLSALVKSYIHMSVNRIIEHNPRYHEMVFSDFLHQYYQSQLRRKSTSFLNQNESIHQH